MSREAVVISLTLIIAVLELALLYKQGQVEELRDKNRQLRDENDSLGREVDLLFEQNRQLAKQAWDWSKANPDAIKHAR